MPLTALWANETRRVRKSARGRASEWDVSVGKARDMKPRLREIEAQPIEHEGQSMLLLRDPLQLSETTIAIPRPLAPLLALMDGTRDEAGLAAALRVRTGVHLAPGLLSKLLVDLDRACLLDNGHFSEAKEAAIRAFREAPFRPTTTLDGSGAVADPGRMTERLQAYVDALPPQELSPGDQPLRGLISPHIDYQRGGLVYAQVWQAAAQAAREAELVVIFGSEIYSSHGKRLRDRQSYATPWGVLPTDAAAVEALAEALGPEETFREELHHRGEHSIELAAIWLHFVRGGEPVPVVPILCGRFWEFIGGEGHPARYQPFSVALDVLRQEMASRRTLVVAAADLAHVGPAFGDPYGLDFVAQAQLRSADERLLAAIYAGDEEAFFEQLKAEANRRNVCGIPPIYLTLRLLGETVGEPAGYDQCPADPQGLSFVSIAGVTLR